MAQRGYYRHPTIHGDTVVFVSEDDLWRVSADGGEAIRLTANPGMQLRPRLSPDGRLLAFISRDEGQLEVFVMEIAGGPARRLSHLGAMTQVVGWTPDGESVLVATDHLQPFAGWSHLWRVPLSGTPAQPLGLGPAWSVTHAPRGGGLALGRNMFDPARWKRYRGGRAGTIWVDRDGSGTFAPLVDLPGNLADPMWIGRRIFFLSDHEGVGNLYSVTPTGRGLTRHTSHEDFYVRYPASDGRRIVYHCGADLWILDPDEDGPRRLDVTVPSSRPQLNRRFQGPGKFLESVALHPQGHSLAVTARGGAFTLPLWEGTPIRHGPVSRHRRRLATWLSDGERVASVTDEHGEEALVVGRADGAGEEVVIERDFGRIRTLDASPSGGARVALTNHRHELILVDLARKSRRVLYRSPYSWIAGTAWSPDGRWLAFSAGVTRTTLNLFLYDTSNRQLHQIGRPEFADFAPSFDPDGTYLAFLSSRVFDPVADSVFHQHGFPRSVVPMLVPLGADQSSPFDVSQRQPRPPGGNSEGSNNGGRIEVDIDLEGIEERIQVFPVAPGRYTRIVAVRGRVLVLGYPTTGSRPPSWVPAEPPKGTLQAWDFSTDRLDTVAEGVTGVTASADGRVVGIRLGPRLRVVQATWKDDKSGKDSVSRETGWVDLDRIRLEVRPVDEWRQMFTEAWRLQRDYYWFEGMGGIDWLGIHDRYLALVDRLASRSEFSDLVWEMQGELGTSHAYEMGGDYRPEPDFTQGSLGVDLRWERGAWRIDHIPQGDPWDRTATSPLAAPGVAARPGDRVLAVDGATLGREDNPRRPLVDRAGRTVAVTLARGRSRPRTVVVEALASERPLRYRDWVHSNREKVREMSEGRAGYIHIPDMMSAGYSEFHRAWRSELDSDGLVIDVRFNRGGNVSQLLLEKLVRKRLGYRVTRWREPSAFPYDSPMGPMVCLTNEHAGSDGDIFSHSFKLHGLGPLIGTRTWGGVVGIWPQQALVDGTITTQPEFGTWFVDVGYTVENYGTDPDIEVVISPQDHRQGRDPQIERGVTELMKIIEASEPLVPDFGPAPVTAPPRLPR